ncbi:ribose-5-phosphate isomerase [Candidatus Levyibacteriota bacterium]|nr:RpiB/LacA/LacB family sugar-phosphate isomerase [Candidatus Levybacteria bacterium]GDX62217.1 ribose-5-phosphate isomerase [Candidatus Levybacteria bacterium]
MKIYLGTDHAGIFLKNKVKEMLNTLRHEVIDCGAYEFDKNDDYPDFIGKVAEYVSNDSENSRGIIFGGSGQGEAMVANKYKNIRCALFYSKAIPIHAVDADERISVDPLEIIKLTREHNHANVLSIGARFVTEEDALAVIKLWLNTNLSIDERHSRRVEKIKKIEQNSK